jgi:hypothetical protein
MNPSWRLLPGIALLSISCARTESPPPRNVVVHIEGSAESARFQRKRGAPPIDCSKGCDVTLPTGEIVLSGGGGESPAVEEAVFIEGPSRLRFVGGSRTLRTTGLVVAVATSIALPLSLLGTFGCISDREKEPNKSCAGWWALSGVVAAGIPAGWVMHAAGASRFQVEPLEPTARLPLRMTLAHDRGFVEWTFAF